MTCTRKIGPYDCCTIVQGDCLELMKQLPDGCVDAVITDPPYGVDLDYANGLHDSFDNWKSLASALIPASLRVARRLLFSTSKFEGEQFLAAHTSPIWRICWFKGACDTRTSVGFKDWETIYLYGEKPHVQFHDHFYACASNARREVEGHPCPKPEDWAMWLVPRFSEFADVVVDTYAGTGTTLVAAAKLGRHFLGFEISPEYCEIARKRLALVEAQPTLFAPKPEQTELEL